MKPIQSLLPLLPSSHRQKQQQIDSVYDDKTAKLKHSQKITKNITPLAGPIISELHVNKGIENNEVSSQKNV